MNSPVDELKPTWVRWTGSYGVLISGRFVGLNISDIRPRTPFLDFEAVPLRDLILELADEVGLNSLGVGGIDSAGSG